MNVILASGSPRRRQILEQVGIHPEIIVSNADETVTGAPDAQVKELALRKANAVLPLVDTTSSENLIIIAADTLVFINNEVLGKPETPGEAFKMLKKLQGTTHHVYTGVALLKGGGESHVFADMAEVTFRPLSDAEINAYIETGEPFDKAGAYGIQERGATLVDRINGDFYTVMGLPISKVYPLLTS